eukprot:m.69145 g.69145  ORF g.69145 m.69145 type:complete len:795 (+) comp24056_c0_seq1:258-2642(+)
MHQKMSTLAQKMNFVLSGVLLFSMFELQCAMPAIWNASPVLPNHTAMLRFAQPVQGTGSMTPRSFRMCQSGGNSNASRCLPVQVNDDWNRGSNFIVPPSLAMSVWSVEDNATGEEVARINEADPWWALCQGKDQLSGSDCVPGSVLRVFGRSLSFSNGSCALTNSQVVNGTTVQLRNGDSQVVNFGSESSSCYSASFVLPPNLPPGVYTVAVRNNLPGSTFVPVKPSAGDFCVSASQTIITLGPVPAGDVEQLHATLNTSKFLATAAKRVVVQLSPGTYVFGELDTVIVPDGVSLVGSSMAATILTWPTQTGAVCNQRIAAGGADSKGALIASSQKTRGKTTLGWGMSDLSVVVEGGFAQNDTKMVHPCPAISPCIEYTCSIASLGGVARAMSLKRINVSIIAAVGGVDGDAANGGVGMGPAIQFYGEDNSMQDCIVTTYGNCGSNVTPLLTVSGNTSLFQNNVFNFGCTLYSMTSVIKVLWESNIATHYLSDGRDGSVIATFAPPFRVEYISFFNNTQTDNPTNPPMPHIANKHRLEGLTLDGGGGAYTGGVSSVQGTTLTLATAPYGPGSGSYAPSRDFKPDSNWEGAAVLVLEGTGAGQWRRVTRNYNRTWVVDTPFTVVPDTTSLIQIVPLRSHVLLVGNTWTTAFTVQLYAMCIHAVVADNTLDTTPFYVWGRSPHLWGYQPNWNIEVLGNKLPQSRGITALTCDQKYNVCGEGANTVGMFNGPLNQAIRISGNSLMDGEGISIHGTGEHVNIEYNNIHNAAGSFMKSPIQVNSTYTTHVSQRCNVANA